MESVKKWLSGRTIKKNGLYVHHSPPKVVGGVSSAGLRALLRLGGGGGRLERAVLAGQGRGLLAAATGALPLPPHLVELLEKCEAVHAAVERGSLAELQELLSTVYNKRKIVACRDKLGVGLLHKSVFYDYPDITEWLVANYPQLVHQKDNEGRTALHYAGATRHAAATAALLEAAGAARGARDAAGRTPAHYRGSTRPELTTLASEMPREQQQPPALVIKRHHIRIWCHDCDMGKLQRVVWEGHGGRLLSEVCSQPTVKRFLEAVPYIMNTIHDIHKSVVENNLEELMRHAGDPVPPVALSCRDANNMTVMHKAAGLGHGGILQYITERYPRGINDVDNDLRTPLHYAAAVRDEQHTYNTLVQLGADEGALDSKNKTPGYYVTRQHEIDKNLFKIIPDAPRTPSSAYPLSWDWKLLETEVIAELGKKSRRKNTSQNTNTVSESTHEPRTGMKTSSTHEFIKALPELDDMKKSQEDLTTKDEIAEENNAPDNNEVKPAAENGDKEKVNEAEEKVGEDEAETQEAKVNETENNTDEASNKEAEAEIQPDNTEATPEANDEFSNKDDAEVKVSEVNPENAEENKTNAKEKVSEVNDENGEENIEDTEKANENEEETADAKTQIEKTQNIKENADDTNEQHENNRENVHDDPKPTTNEGNFNEDDDDVKGGTPSEYSNFNARSTAEATDTTDTASAKRGHESNGRRTQDSLIEGLVSADAEMDSQDAGVEQRDDSVQGEVFVVDSEIDPEVTELIRSANMEMLAALVLNGEGARLIGRQSKNAELHSFLENVPAYMEKIHKVHLAAREGNIRDLQAALDRRKFAIARDPTSPNGATPLHVATVHGKTNIIKYLGGRFPETLSAVDFEGRTALHYAAVIPDNGYYFNLLQQLGANSKDLDDSGRSAEDCLQNPDLLPLDQLLSDFGISNEDVQDMLSDKGRGHAENGHMDIPNFKTDEGRYLAKSLGDPLIKGLTEVANVKPKDPVAFLASFLHNFPEHEKPRLGTQTNELTMTVAPEVENNDLPPRETSKTATLAPAPPIDVITMDPLQQTSPDAPEAAFSSANRDEHGQSMLHFAAARAHTRNALFELLQESDISLAYRDELYRTARDISIQANVPENTVEIDRWVLHLAARGNTEKIMELLLEGYDHILDVVDEEGVPISEVISQRNDTDMAGLLASIPAFEESRENLHGAIRRGNLPAVRRALEAEGGRTLARSKNSFGRTSLHVAVLAQREELVEYLADNFPELLRIGDNLERTPLHYAMGDDKMESLSRVLIRAGAKRVLKDLKGRQPSYYFMNKSDIMRLKEEEEVY